MTGVVKNLTAKTYEKYYQIKVLSSTMMNYRLVIECTADFEGFVSLEFLQKVCCVEFSSHSFFTQLNDGFVMDWIRQKIPGKANFDEFLLFLSLVEVTIFPLSFLLSYVHLFLGQMSPLFKKIFEIDFACKLQSQIMIISKILNIFCCFTQKSTFADLSFFSALWKFRSTWYSKEFLRHLKIDADSH